MSTQHLGNTSTTSMAGIRVQRVNGIDMVNIEDVQAALCREIAKMPRETRPMVLAAEDARSVIHELTAGIGGDMEAFRRDSKKYLEELRGVKFATVSELTAMKKELAEVRAFFHGADHDREVARLKEFVELCERLNALKQSGFLDTIADTMLKLA